MNQPTSASYLTAVQALSSSHADIDACEKAVAGWSVLLWSQSQNTFHVERIRHMLRSNRLAYAEDRRMDYVPIFVGSGEHCSELADKLRGTIRVRDADRGLLGGV